MRPTLSPGPYFCCTTWTWSPRTPEPGVRRPSPARSREGYVWGRGAIDDKGLGTIHLIAFLLLARSGVPLGRDVILMAVADEEEGGGDSAPGGW